MKNQAQRKNGSIALLGALVLTLLGLGACVNPLQGPKDESPDGSTGVRINIVTGGERTLLPSGEFSSYKLVFASNNAATHAPYDMTDTSAEISLAPATWTITVTASVWDEVNNKYVEAAGGVATPIVLNEGERKEVSVRISAMLGQDKGYFSYDVSYPKDVVEGKLIIFDSGDFPVYDKDLVKFTESEDPKDLPSGYYRMQVTVATEYSIAVRTEIVHIYPGMETRWDHGFTAADFGVPIAISGTLNLSNVGGTVDAAEIFLLQDGYQEAHLVKEPPFGQWSWTIRTLPFNKPTDLDVKLVLHFSGGGELIRWLSVPAVYNKNVTALNFGSLKVDTFKLGGTFDFDKLDPLGITLTTASVYIFYGDQNPVEVPFDTLDEEQSWLHNLFGEPNSPVRIVLKINTSVGSFYSEIQKTLTGKLDSLEFETGMISAGTTINGVGVNSGYSYLFEPATSGDYGFTVSSSQPVNLSAVAVMGSAPNPKGSGIWGLSKGLYLITLTLTNPNQTFQFRVDPVTQATLKGTIDFTELLKPFDEGAVIGGVGVAVYADNSAHTPLAAPATVVFEDDTWKWSASFDLAGATPAVVVSGVTINGHSFYHQEYLAISGDKSDLTFTPKAITGSGPVLRTTTDQLLYVPAVTGLYSLKVSVAAGDVGLTLFDATKADPALANANGNGEAEIVKELTEGTPYRIGVSSAPSPLAYQFQAAVLAPVTLSGTVNFTGLAALPGGIKNTDIQVYNINGPSPVKLLEKPVAVNNGVWTVNLPPASNQNVMIVASVYLNNGLQINSQIDKAITRLGAKDLYLAPTTIASGEHGLTVYAGSEGTWLLWNPGVAGEYVLDAVRTPGKDAENPHLYLYNGLDGTQIADNDNSNGAFDSRIQRSDFVAGRPYLLRVTEAHGAGTFTVKVARAVSGTVNLAGLAPLTGDDISRTEIQVYTSSLAPLLGAPVTVESGAWTAILPYASTDQAVKVVASVLLKNNGRINSQIDTSLTGAKVNLAPAPTTSGVWHDRTVYDGNGTWLRWIPSITGEYVLDVEETDGFMAPYIAVYDADVDQLGGVIADDDNDGDLIQIKHLFVAEHPYLVMVKDAANKPGTFRFKAARSVSGTVNINGLAPAIVAADIDRTEIQVYNAGGSALGSPVKVENGAWTVIMPSTDQTVSIVASVYLKKGGQITASQIGVDLTTGATVPFAPAAITDDAWHAGTYAGSNGTWLLWVPAETAAYVLDAEKTGENNNTNPYMYLYDGSTGNLIVGDDNGGGNSNPRIQRNVEANHPYLVRVKDVGNGVGAFRFKAVVEP